MFEDAAKRIASLLAMAFISAGLVAANPADSRAAAGPASVADLAERLSPAVVNIATTQKIDTPGAKVPMPQLPPNSPFKEFFDDFFKKQQEGEGGPAEPRTVNSLGSGFVIDASGIIVTNNHVIEQADSIQAIFTDGTSLKAELIGKDIKTDLAVLRVKPATPLTAVQFGDSDKLRVGDWVMAIGNPFGLGGSVSMGIVSARNRDINAGPYDDFLQTDAAINKGNSGGPLFNMDGEVVGINTAIYSPSGGSVGIGFSVPAASAKGVVGQLVRFGETRRGWLGVRIQQVTDELVDSLKIGQAHGALIADVTPTGPAEIAGIQAGDVIIEFDGKTIREMKDLPRAVADTEVGKTVTVKLIRKGQAMTVNAVVGRLEDAEKLVTAQGGAEGEAAVTALGMTVSSITDALRERFNIDKDVTGAVVTAVDAGSPAAEKRIEPGDVITEAGEKEVKAPADIEARVKDAETEKRNSVLLLVSKGGKQGEMRFVAVKLKND